MFELIPFSRETSDISKSFKDFEKRFFGDAAGIAGFKSDVRDLGDKYVLEADLPGFNKENIIINADENYLTISAKRTSSVSSDKNSYGNYLRRERTYGSFKRSFSISGIQWDKIEASYNEGVLTVVLPKDTNGKTVGKRITIN